MMYFRSIIFYLGEALSTIPFFLLFILLSFLPPKTRSKVFSSWAHFITWWLKITVGLKYELIHKENIPNQPTIFACNHSSTWETIVTQTFLPPLAWVLKKELLKIPFFGWGLWASRPIAIDRQDRKNALEQVIEQGIKKLAEGRSILIYPEGTRSAYGEVGKYKKGAAKLALNAKTNIVPIAHDAGKYWNKSSFWIKPGTVKCIIGPVIEVENKTDQQITDEIRNWIVSQNL